VFALFAGLSETVGGVGAAFCCHIFFFHSILFI
jgi:hypothetical protein